MNTHSDLDRKLTQLVELLLVDHSFETPVYFALIDPRGSFLCGGFQPNSEGLLQPQMVEHLCSDGALVLPLAVLFVDSTGRRKTASFEAGEDQAPTIN